MQFSHWSRALSLVLFGGASAALSFGCDAGPASGTGGGATSTATGTEAPPSDPDVAAGTAAINAGRDIFRHDTFGDEVFWGGALKMHRALEGKALGGFGPGVSPKTALAVGLKVDSEALPAEVVSGVKNGTIRLDDPATTVALLKLDAVVGAKVTMNADGTLKTIGFQCALCHSTVDDSFAPGIGKRLDGWANRDLNFGAIVNLSEDLTPLADALGVSQAAVRTVLASWGPGKYDAEVFLDGRAVRPDGKPGATLIPPAFGLAGVNQQTYTGWGSIPYWNAFVAVLEMHGQGNFFDSRLDDAAQFPVAAKNKLGHTTSKTDLVTSKLPALQAYQLALAAPPAPAGSFDVEAAGRGKSLFEVGAQCAMCHMGPAGTDAGWNMHTAEEIGIDDFQSSRAPSKAYRTTPLRGLWTHQKGGFYHDGRFATLLDVVNHYDTTQKLGLTSPQKSDLVEYLKSL